MVRMTGTLTIACDTDAEYNKVLGDLQAAGYLNIVGDPVTRTIQFDTDEEVSP